MNIETSELTGEPFIQFNSVTPKISQVKRVLSLIERIYKWKFHYVEKKKNCFFLCCKIFKENLLEKVFYLHVIFIKFRFEMFFLVLRGLNAYSRSH